MTDLTRKIRRGLSLLTVTAFGLILAPLPASMAAQPQDPVQFVQELGDKAIAQLANTGLSAEEEQLRFRRLLDQYFDLAAIGRFTVGRAYWANASADQQQEFLSLYEAQLTDIYAKRFQQYSGERFTVTGQQRDGEGDPVVNSQVHRPSGGAPVAVQWRVRSASGGFKVVDVVIAGISMAATDRQEFAAVIQR
ncbi:MAG: putative toluene tolerance transporter, partial [Rhodospirillales bacterium]|nr:putative toluene tolerance transporter [Rhodospirillales bacterium]